MSKSSSNTHISEYSFEEELINSITHGIGILFSIIGLVILYLQANASGTYLHLISYTIFGSTLVILYTASTCHHSFSNTKFHKIFQKIDHLAIYLLIAGTYSPLMLVGLKDPTSWIMLITIWGLAIISCFLQFSKAKLLKRIAFVNYLLMGWLAIVVIDELIIHLPPKSLYLLIVGGLLYTTGVIFYLWEKLPFNHSIWHLFVLGGSTSHYFSVYSLLILE